MKEEKLVPEKQFLYQALRAAKKVRDIWELEDFLELAQAINDDPELLRKLYGVVQHLLTPSVEKKQTQRNIKNVSGPLYKKGKSSNVKIKDEHKESIGALITILQAHIDEDADATQRGTDKAFHIMEDPFSVAELIAKPRRKSALVTKDPHFADRLSDIIQASDQPLDVAAIHDAYEKVAERKVAMQTVSILLLDMVKNGVINVQTRKRLVGSRKPASPIYTALG